jgi:hypothetical protein
LVEAARGAEGKSAAVVTAQRMKRLILLVFMAEETSNGKSAPKASASVEARRAAYENDLKR